MMAVSHYLFAAAFAAYILSTIFYVGRITLRRSSSKYFTIADGLGRWGWRAAIGSVVIHGGAMALRWIGSGQVPMSNMFEYMSFLGWCVMLFFVIISLWYKVPALGAFVAPVGLIVIAYASVFPQEVKPLVPALQSYWLPLHVSTAALGEGAFAVSFGAGLMYLLRMRKEHSEPWEERTLEGFFFSLCMLIGFIIVALGFKWTGYEVTLTNQGMGAAQLIYHMPPVVGPPGSVSGDAVWAGINLPIFTAPEWMQGVNAARKLNTVVFSILSGAIVYFGLRLAARGPLRELGSRAVAGMDPKLLDEISYRGVAVGFPLFTLGAIVFAMIWAQKAWGSYWQWDPKETWALISWLFYSGYLHMRLVRGWEGRAAAWVTTAGFVLIMFTLVGVNLLISGLHSYA